MIKYRSGYKYQLAGDYTIKTDIIGYSAGTEFLKITPIGVLTIKSGYAWDGPTGAFIHSDSSIRPSLVHDAFYQLIRHEFIPISERGEVDDLFYNLCIDDGMTYERAKIWHDIIKRWAGYAAYPKSKKKILTAPNKRRQQRGQLFEF